MKLRGLIALALAFVLIAEPALAQVNQGTSPLSIPKGGTGGATAAAARASLGAMAVTGTSTDRTIPSWNGTSGNLLRNNPTISINSLGALQMDSGTGATTVLWNVPSTGMLDNGLANSTLMVGNGGTTLVHNAGTFVGSVSGTTLTVTAITTGTVPVERVGTATLSGGNVTVGTQIRAQVSGTPGGIGVYTVSPSQGVATPGGTTLTAISLQGRYTTCVGLTTCNNMTTASYNTYGGFESGEFVTTAFGNAGWGEANQIYNIDGSGNDSSGWKALLGTQTIGLGDYSTCHGYFACSNSAQVAPTSRNTGIGAFALSAGTLSTNDNTAVGYNSAGVMTSGSGLFLGSNSAPTLTTGTGNFFAAAGQAGAGIITGANDVILGSCSGLSSSLSNMVQFCDGAGNVAFRNDSNRDTYLGDGAVGRKVYNYFSSATNAAGTTADASGIWHVFTGTSSLANWINVYPDGSTTLGAPTGANKGAGTLNLQSDLYNNGTAPTGTGGYARATNPTFAALVNTGLTDISGASAGQIKFPATQNPSADANTLDDYKESSWTPAVTFGGGSTGITYGTQVGFATKIGRIVLVSAELVFTNKGSSTGVALITGLPVTNIASTTPCSVQINNFAAGTITTVQATVSTSATNISLSRYAAGANTALADTDFTNTSVLRVSCTYASTT
jgi:hypothetical protein